MAKEYIWSQMTEEEKKAYEEGYLDIIPHWEYESDEEYEKAIAEIDEKSRNLKEWIPM